MAKDGTLLLIKLSCKRMLPQPCRASSSVRLALFVVLAGALLLAVWGNSLMTSKSELADGSSISKLPNIQTIDKDPGKKDSDDIPADSLRVQGDRISGCLCKSRIGLWRNKIWYRQYVDEEGGRALGEKIYHSSYHGRCAG